MAITGKKFSELTQEQQIATRTPITGWLVNNLFINPLGSEITFKSNLDLVDNKDVYLMTSAVVKTINVGEGGDLPVGSIKYIINWGTVITQLIAGDGVVLSPYPDMILYKPFGVFKLELTDVNEWVVAVIENGEIIDTGEL